MPHRIYSMPVASVYPNYVAKVERKGHTVEELEEVIFWLTGHDQKSLKAELDANTDFDTFFKTSPHMNPNRKLITGVICGVRVEDIEEPTMQEIRYLDKLVDELANGRSKEKIFRT